MKKLLALLTALMLLTGCCAALAQTGHTREDFIGVWKLEDELLRGVSIMEEDVDAFIAIHEDDTAIVNFDDHVFFGAPVSYKDGVCTLENGDSDFVCTIGADGRLNVDTQLDGMEIQMICSRTQERQTTEQIAGWAGEWKLTEASMGGRSMTGSMLSQYSLTMYPEGFGMLQLGDMRATFELWEENGRVVGIDVEDVSFAMWTEGDVLCLSMPDQDLTFRAVRVTAEAAPAAAPAGQDHPFEGVWRAQSFEIFGMKLTAAEADLNLTMTVDGYAAMLDMDGEKTAARLRVEGNTCYLTEEGVDVIVCELGEDGVLVMTLEADGLEMQVYMTREGGVPREEQPAAQTGADVNFDGVWHAESYELLGTVLTAEDMSVTLTLTVKDGVALLETNDDQAMCQTVVSGNTLTLTDGRDTIPCVLGEDGVLVMQMTSDGVTMTVRLTREGGAPAEAPAETPAETPAAAPAASAFQGEWHADSFALMGMTLTVEEAGMSVTMTVEGDSALVRVDDVEARCNMTVDGNTCVLSDHTDETITCTLQEDGTLVMVMIIDGLELRIHMVREGGAPAPAATPATAQSLTPAAGAPAQGYDGQWNIVQVERAGEVYPAEALGVTGGLKVTGESARYTVGDTSSLGIVTINGSVLALSTRSGEYEFLLNTQGLLCLQTTLDGENVVLYLAREGSAPAPVAPATTPVPAATPSPATPAPTSAPQAPAEGFDGRWLAGSAEVMGMVFTLEELGVEEIRLQVNGSAATLTVGGSEVMCTVTEESGSLILTGDGQSMKLYRNADGLTVLEMKVDGIDLKALMTYEGE